MRAHAWITPEDGRSLTEAEALLSLAEARVVCLGETHDRADIHLWQRDVIAGLAALRPRLAVGFEMFPRRVQAALDDWTAGALTEAAFLEAADWRTVWGFDPDLYLPIFRLCRERGIPMRAINVERPLISRIGRDGWQGVPEAELEGVTPAAPASPRYRRHLFELTGGARPDREAQDPQDRAFDRFVRAQGVWDRAFACGLAEAAAGPERPLAIGIIGRGHLEFGGGTPAQLADLGVEEVRVAVTRDAGDPAPAPGLADLVHVLPG